VNGSPTCTLGRFASAPSPNSCDARIDAPPIPSRPVFEPKRSATSPAFDGPPFRISSSSRIPTHIAFTRGLPEYAGSNTASPPTVGSPSELP
jgi:hypothetical protein